MTSPSGQSTLFVYPYISGTGLPLFQYLSSFIQTEYFRTCLPFLVWVQLDNPQVEGQGDRGQPPPVRHRRRVGLVLGLEPEVLQEPREEQEYLRLGQTLVNGRVVRFGDAINES